MIAAITVQLDVSIPANRSFLLALLERGEVTTEVREAVPAEPAPEPTTDPEPAAEPEPKPKATRKKSSRKKAATKKSAKPTEPEPAPEKPAEEKPAEEKPAEEKPAEEITAEAFSAALKSAGDVVGLTAIREHFKNFKKADGSPVLKISDLKPADKPTFFAWLKEQAEL